jgi:hypothetical protein
MARPDLPADLNAVTVGEANVEKGNVGTRRGDPAECRRGRVGFADDFDVVFGLEQLAYAAPHDLVIVEQEDPRRPAPRHARSVTVGVGQPVGISRAGRAASNGPRRVRRRRNLDAGTE